MPRKLRDRDTIDYSQINVHYLESVRHNLKKPEKIKTVEMLLQLGKEVSRYSSYLEIYDDSICDWDYRNTDKLMYDILNESLARKAGGFTSESVIYNKKTKEYLYQNYIPFCGTYMYIEEQPHIAWQMTQDTATVFGYVCYKAMCTFRGRDYTAWFAPGIPVFDGPWKLKGLPGLVLKAEDSKGDYKWEVLYLYTVKWKQPIVHCYGKNIKTTREKYLKMERNAHENSGGMLQQTGMVGNMTEEGIQKSTPYNPAELE